MEWKRSFPTKPTRFLMFSFTISTSLIILIFFFIWVLKFSPSFNQQTHFQFNDSSSIYFTNIQALTVTNISVIEAKPSILLSTQKGPEKESENNKVGAKDEITKGDILDNNFTNFTQNKNLEVNSRKSQEFTYIGDILDNNFTQSKNLSLDGVDNSVLEANYSRKSQEITNFAKKIDAGLVNTRGSIAKSSSSLSEQFKASVNVKIQEKSVKGCDFARGKWVFDESYPLYTNVSCPFIDEGFNCEANGRLDKDYMKWRWQPQDCDLPRFNPTKMLELIRGKRLVFVGDSVNRNQWESLLCLLMGAIKDPKKVYETRGRRITKGKGNYSFKFVDYKCTIEFYVTHFLVHESKGRVGKKRVQTLRIDTIDKGSSRWRRADILVFNTAHWWNHHKTQSGINYYQEKDQVIPRLDVSDAFQRALLTWASWVDKNIHSQGTQVFFRSSAPSHFSGGQWNSGGHCKESSKPLDIITNPNYPERNNIVEAIIRQMRTPVTYLNITTLSDYRIDGHPSLYGRMNGNSYSSGGQDCSHWCLPGVPDTWNLILYSHLLFKG
ncbi:hypothetical protein Leryth_026533 [Lithospermum erythrorhizon]|nr:hypothetical protein Leryth_026533 [Lithospermum erythrorhizon]